MTPEQIVAASITALLSVAAIAISVKSLINSRKASQVSTELLIQQLISGTRKDTHEFLYTISDGDKAVAKELLNAYIEQELNTYDVACAAYIDEKIDRVRFEKTYSTEIRNLFEHNKNTKKVLDKPGRYNAIKKVYEEWSNLEK